MVTEGAIKLLVGLLDSDKKKVYTSSIFALSNIAAGTQPQIQELLRMGAIHRLALIMTQEKVKILILQNNMSTLSHSVNTLLTTSIGLTKY